MLRAWMKNNISKNDRVKFCTISKKIYYNRIIEGSPYKAFFGNDSKIDFFKLASEFYHKI
jgi:hypothetical protein